MRYVIQFLVQYLLVRCSKNIDFLVFSKVSLSNPIFCARIIISVALQEIDNAPDTKTGTERDNEGLKNGDCLFKKCHIVC